MKSPEQLHRNILEESGEILRSDERAFKQSQEDESQAQWDSLKDVPFAGDQEEEAQEEEMSM